MVKINDQDEGDLQPPVMVDDQHRGADEYPEVHLRHAVHLVNVLRGKNSADGTQHILIKIRLRQQSFGDEIGEQAQAANTQGYQPRFIEQGYEDPKGEHQQEQARNDAVCLYMNIRIKFPDVFLAERDRLHCTDSGSTSSS
jgi:hypothetical protein